MRTEEVVQILNAAGALVGAVVAGISAFLLYRALKEQLKMNASMRSAQQIESLRLDILAVRRDVAELKYYRTEQREDKTFAAAFEGRAAVEVFAEDFSVATSHDELLNTPLFQDLYFVLGRFDVTIRRISKAPIDEAQKHELLRDISFLYSGKCMLGMSILLAAVEVEHKLKATVNTTEMTRVTHFDQMLKCHKKLTELIVQLQL